MSARPLHAPAEHASIDVSALPTTVFGQRAHTWWGTIGFIAAEGTTLLVCAVAYLYVRKNFSAWPPENTPLPDLLIPTIQAALMLLSIPVMLWTKHAAARLDVAASRRGMIASTAFVLAFCVLRWFEFHALRTRWDSHAYGSAVWAILVAHATLLVAQLGESAIFSIILTRGPVKAKHLSDVDDACIYWFFMIGSWIVLYLLVFVSPRFH
jgi:heme/copper-type cytochrome/quinol oxidase subunit 3